MHVWFNTSPSKTEQWFECEGVCMYAIVCTRMLHDDVTEFARIKMGMVVQNER